MSSAITFARNNYPRFLEELKTLIRIPSISTLPEHKSDVLAAANWLAADLKKIGMEHVEVITTSGHPLVYADWLHAPGKPTCLCYGHYDVQPPDPLDEWKSPPFDPTVRDGNLYARGAVDDKGQMFMHLKALEALFEGSRILLREKPIDGQEVKEFSVDELEEGSWKPVGHVFATKAKLPINIRIILEGEEEVGGEQIARFIREHPDRLKADFALVSDTEMFAPELPTLCVGLRGMIYTEIEARGAKSDLHSGMYGGAAPNPFVALAQIIAQLKDSAGRILIPGFYDAVRRPSDDELRAWQQLPFDEEHYRLTEVGSSRLTGEPGYSVLERTWARPSLDVHGMPGGFTGAGAKTVIPARAVAKVSMRLVPDQTPQQAFAQYKSYVESLKPDGIELDVRLVHSGDPIVIGTGNPWIQAATRALKKVWDKDTVFIRSGGSIPIVGDIERHLKIPAVMMGFGLPDDNLHAPNEKFHLANFRRGIESIIEFLEEAGRSEPST
jgi:acetylornithine deacetylase/succinyl-diaminopimelate desuccinylase-like protein